MSMNHVELKSFDYTHGVLPRFKSLVTPQVVEAVAKLAAGTDLPSRDSFRSDADFVLCMLRPGFAGLCVAFYHTRPEACIPLARELEPELLSELDAMLVAEVQDLG